MCCRSTIQNFTGCLSKQARTHHNKTVHPGNHNAGILHILHQHNSKESTDNSGSSIQHYLICANHSAPHIYVDTSAKSATARSLASGDFIPHFPSASPNDFNGSALLASPDGAPNPPSLNGSASPLLAALTPVAASPATDAAFSEFATTLSPQDTASPLAYPPASPPVSYSVSAPHGPYNSRNSSGIYDDSNPKAQKTEMAYGLGGLGLIVLILVCACLLARHVKVSTLLQCCAP